MRVLVTNDDGVHAPGLAAITCALARWAVDADGGHEVVVVAPLANHSGASAAVGTVYEREAISYRRVRIDGAEDVPTYGVDAPPALAVLVGALGGFGPRPDIVVSGINLGVNVGRSVLHSGTVGATLSGAQLGLRGLAVSLRAGFPPEQWSTASTIAVALLPALCAAPPRTVLNLNVPSVPIEELRGVRRARISTSGIVKAATGGVAPGAGGPAQGGGPEEGEVRLRLGTAIPTLGRVDESEDPEDDAALIAAGYASLTPIVGVREDTAPDSDEIVRAALSSAHHLLRR
ncbi:MAG TPA: 5'/3'-nucleotidase SurE [Acidimicrobiales bacterium]|nr:5'/3'-nucleotidase SurE [Acidimicrobiales bacterium]